MKPRIRQPAFQAPQPLPAVALGEDPTPRLLAMYQRIWATCMHDMPFVNPALRVEVLGFRRWSGDWVGAVITPWFLNLFILPGGGALWSDRPSGEHGKIAFPVGELEFIADDDLSAEIPAYQYCPLFAPVGQFATQDAARAAAEDALTALFTAPPVEQTAAADLPPPSEQPDPARRAFFRRVAGR